MQFTCITVLFVGLVLSLNTLASAHSTEQPPIEKLEIPPSVTAPAFENSYLNVNIGVDTDGLALAAERITTATQNLTESILLLAQNPNLSAEQKQELHDTLDKMGKISISLNSAITELPNVVEQSRQPLLGTLDQVGSRITWTLSAIGAALFALLVLGLWLFYRLVLQPVQNAIVTTSQNLSVLSQSLQHTAELVEKIQQQQTPAPAAAIADQNKDTCGEPSSS